MNRCSRATTGDLESRGGAEREGYGQSYHDTSAHFDQQYEINKLQASRSGHVGPGVIKKQPQEYVR